MRRTFGGVGRSRRAGGEAQICSDAGLELRDAPLLDADLEGSLTAIRTFVVHESAVAYDNLLTAYVHGAFGLHLLLHAAHRPLFECLKRGYFWL